jgi:hypothetical protein
MQNSITRCISSLIVSILFIYTGKTSAQLQTETLIKIIEDKSIYNCDIMIEQYSEDYMFYYNLNDISLFGVDCNNYNSKIIFNDGSSIELKSFIRSSKLIDDKLYVCGYSQSELIFYLIDINTRKYQKLGTIENTKVVLLFNERFVVFIDNSNDTEIVIKYFNDQFIEILLSIDNYSDESLNFSGHFNIDSNVIILDYGIWEGGFVEHFYFKLDISNRSLLEISKSPDLFWIIPVFNVPDIGYYGKIVAEVETGEELPDGVFNFKNELLSHAVPMSANEPIGVKKSLQQVEKLYFKIKYKEKFYIIDYYPTYDYNKALFSIYNNSLLNIITINELSVNQRKQLLCFILAKNGYTFPHNKFLNAYFSIYNFKKNFFVENLSEEDSANLINIYNSF